MCDSLQQPFVGLWEFAPTYFYTNISKQCQMPQQAHAEHAPDTGTLHTGNPKSFNLFYIYNMYF